MNSHMTVGEQTLRRATMLNNVWMGAYPATDAFFFQTELSALLHGAFTNEEYALLANTVDFAMLGEDDA